MNSRRSSPTLTCFGCPELCHIIARYLNQTDLYRCLLVDKTLFKSLFPYLWRSISFSDFGPYYGEFLHLDRQQQLQLQQGDQFGGTDYQTTTSAPKQRRQERPYIHDYGIPNPWAQEPQEQADLYFPLSPPYSSLILHGHLIDTLTLEWDEALDFLPDPEMANCPEPEEESGKMQTWIYIRLLQQCPNIRVLKIRGRDPELPYRRPKWDWCGTGREDEFLGKYATTGAKDQALAKIISAAGLSGSDHLDMTSSSDGEGGPEVLLMEEEERAHTEANKLKATNAKATGIQEFYISNCCGFSSKSFKALTQAFSPPSRLRVLDISACEHIQSSWLQILLEQFPGLQEVDFRCREHLTSLFADSGLDFGTVYVKSRQYREFEEEEEEEDGLVYNPSLMRSGSGSGNREDNGCHWACQESLRVLRIGINGAVMDERRPLRPLFSTINTGTVTAFAKKQMKEGPFDVCTGLEYPACFHGFYNHIAKLINLRELCLVSVWENMPYALEVKAEVRFTLEEGLDRLAGLKQLEILDVEHLHHRIGVAELQWMVVNWPRLRVIRGLVFEEDAHAAVISKVEDDTGVKMAVEESDGWSEGASWLKMARPDIEVPILERRWKGNSVLAYPELDEDL